MAPPETSREGAVRRWMCSLGRSQSHTGGKKEYSWLRGFILEPRGRRFPGKNRQEKKSRHLHRELRGTGWESRTVSSQGGHHTKITAQDWSGTGKDCWVPCCPPQTAFSGSFLHVHLWLLHCFSLAEPPPASLPNLLDTGPPVVYLLAVCCSS